MREILGNKKGIRDSVLNELIALYDVQVPLGQLISAELALKLADITEFINREISLYISRSGQITNIVIGGNDSVELPAVCLLYTSPSPRDGLLSRMPSSA